MKEWTVLVAAPEQYDLYILEAHELADLLYDEEAVVLEVEEA
jgi:hypothetical protein